MAGAVEGEHFVGKRASELRGLLSLRHPMQHGIVNDWADQERVWQHCYGELRAQAKEHPLLITEAPLNPRAQRERAAELLFEAFGVPALFVSQQAILSLYASGRTTGLVLDCGAGTSSATPVFEGFALPHAIERVDLAGRDVTLHLQRLLRRAGYTFRTSAELEVVRDVKESLCFVALDAAKAESSGASSAAAAVAAGGADAARPQQYRLPDGQLIELGAERFRAPEILFRPSLVGDESHGVADCVASAVRRADLELRRPLWGNIVLSGGTTLLPGFGERLLHELKALGGDVKINISAPKERRFSTWMGGSILATLGTFKQMWVLRKEYEDEGSSVVNRFF
jgi:centractin